MSTGQIPYNKKLIIRNVVISSSKRNGFISHVDVVVDTGAGVPVLHEEDWPEFGLRKFDDDVLVGYYDLAEPITLKIPGLKSLDLEVTTRRLKGFTPGMFLLPLPALATYRLTVGPGHVFEIEEV